MPTTTAERTAGPSAFVRITITFVMAVTVGLAFVFSFGNIWAFAAHLGVPQPLAPLIGPMVDLSVAGLMVAIYHHTLTGTNPAELRPEKTLLHLCGLLTLALNTAQPITTGHFGRAAVDCVAPALLIGWGAVGPRTLRRLNTSVTASGDQPGGTDHSGIRRPEAEHASERVVGGNPTPQPVPELSPEADADQDHPRVGEPVVDSRGEAGPASQEPAGERKRTGRRPKASLDELVEIARPAVEEHGPTIAVIRTALREASVPVSSERLGKVTQRFKDEQAAQQAEEPAHLSVA